MRLLGLFRPVPATFEAQEIVLRRLRGLGSPGRKTRRAGHHEENEKEMDGNKGPFAFFISSPENPPVRCRRAILLTSRDDERPFQRVHHQGHGKAFFE